VGKRESGQSPTASSVAIPHTKKARTSAASACPATTHRRRTSAATIKAAPHNEQHDVGPAPHARLVDRRGEHAPAQNDQKTGTSSTATTPNSTSIGRPSFQ